MANVKFLMGNLADLPNTKIEGQVYFTYKNVGSSNNPNYVGALYLDKNNSVRIKMTANADIAEKDNAGNTITSTYIKNASISSNGTSNTLTFTKGDNKTFTVTIPAATDSLAGLITNGEQTFSGTKTFNNTINLVNDETGINWSRVTDGASILFYAETDATDNYLDFHVTDDENVNFRWTKTVGSENLILGTWKREGIRLGSGKFIGDLTGNADSATKLKTVRSINGTNFDGTSNITTTSWGTSRTITIGGTSKSVNGGSNVSWSLSEIGASEIGHTHNYAGSTSAGGSANSAVKLTTDTAGSDKKPVYFSGGKPIACTYSLGKSVPSDAVFTDTNTWRPLGTTADTACAGNDSRLSNARPASDVYAWAKASNKPSYTKSEVGLGNVDNTADSQKSVKYATSAGTATKLQTARSLTVQDSTGAYKGTSASFDGSTSINLLMPSKGKFVDGLKLGNGSTSDATKNSIEFYTTSTTSAGAKIIAYSDRIEFVFA